MFILNKRRIPIRRKLFLGVGLFVLINIFITLVFVTAFINDVYIGIEKRELKKEFSLIKSNINNEKKLNNIIYEANNNGIKIKIVDKDLNIINSALNERIASEYDEIDTVIQSSFDKKEYKISMLRDYKDIGYDLRLIGKISDKYIIISSSIESIKKDASTAIVIIMFSASLTLVFLSICAFFLSKIFSNKIKELGVVTDDISNLKFDKKIKIRVNDELGDLFKNVNNMSDKLEESIKSLEIANAKLEQDLKDKEKQEDARKLLIANISHEFKTPLTIISGYSQLLLEDVTSEEDKEYTRIMIEESERLSDLVREFLELSKLESGNMDLDLTEVNMKEVIDKTLKTFDIKIKERNIEVTTSYCKSNNIKTDYKLITRVVENILTNAIKFCTNDKKIIIKTYMKDGYFAYEVYNTCDKLTSKERENIFNSYYKDKSNRNKSGTGLGLTIVNAIVSLHNGVCECHSAKDGIKFIIKIKVQ